MRILCCSSLINWDHEADLLDRKARHEAYLLSPEYHIDRACEILKKMIAEE